MSRLLWIALIIAVLAGAGSLYWESVPKPFERVDEEASGDLVTAELTRVITKSYDMTGALANDFTADQVTYLQVDPEAASEADYALIDKPFFSFYHPERAPWFLRSERGTAYNSNQTLVLEENVRAWQIDNQEQLSEVLTSVLTLYPQRQIAETDKPVMIRFPRVRYNAESMHANFSSEHFTLGGEIEGTHAANP